MHDCKNIQEQLIDLVFGEADATLRAEVEGCAACREEYQAMQRALGAFDQTADAVMPAESYWPGYEARLQARLAEETAGGFLAKLKAWLPALQFQPMPFALGTAALLLLLVLGGLWLSKERNTRRDDLAVVPSPTVTITPTPSIPEIEKPAPPAPVRTVAQKPKKQARPLPARPLAPRPEPQDEFIAMTPAPASFLSPETTRHFEQTQLLLRSFRNSRDAGDDLAYERERSQKLLLQNIVLRRNAEAKGGLPTEEVLGLLEPLLLDIANLPDKPDRQEVQRIRQQIERQEAIAMLQPYAAQQLALGNR